MYVNDKKSNIVQFRPPAFPRSEFVFICDEDVLYTVDKYVYLGITLTGNFNDDVTANVIAQNAGRALEVYSLLSI